MVSKYSWIYFLALLYISSTYESAVLSVGSVLMSPCLVCLLLLACGSHPPLVSVIRSHRKSYSQWLPAHWGVAPYTTIYANVERASRYGIQFLISVSAEDSDL